MQESKIEKALNTLKKAILSEMNEEIKKHRATINERERLKKAISKARDIIHNIPHAKDKEIDNEIEKAWDILDGAR